GWLQVHKMHKRPRATTHTGRPPAPPVVPGCAIHRNRAVYGGHHKHHLWKGPVMSRTRRVIATTAAAAAVAAGTAAVTSTTAAAAPPPGIATFGDVINIAPNGGCHGDVHVGLDQKPG